MTSFASAARHIGPAPHRPRRHASRGPRRLPSGPSLQRCGHLRGAGYSQQATAAHGARRRRRTRRDSDAPVGSPWQTAFVPIRPSARAVGIRGECDNRHLTTRACGIETRQRVRIDRDWWWQRFLLGQGHGEEPAQLREAQNSLDFYLNTRARSRVENSPATWHSIPEAGHAGRSISVALAVRRSASNGRSCGATTSPAVAGVRLSPATQA